MEEKPGSVDFRSRGLFTDAPVVLKLLRAGAGPEFLAEARRAMTLVHPHLVPILDGGDYRGRPYIVAAEVGGLPVTEADLSLRETIGIVRDAALAVEYARGQGFIHGGLGPDCLLVSRTGSSPHADEGRRVYVKDLVLPAKAEPSPFRSPEERKGTSPDARSAVFSLGAIFYALAAGRAPAAPPEPLSSLNPLIDSDLEAVVQKAMDSDPFRRHPHPGALADDLTRRLSGAPEAPAARAKPGRSRTSRRLVAGISAGIGVVLLAGFLVVLLSGDPEPRPDPPPTVNPEVVATVDPVPPVAVPPRAILHVRTTPPGAIVGVVGRAGRWTTPCEITDQELPAGRCEVRIARAGYVEIREVVVLPASGSPFVLERILDPPPPVPVVPLPPPPPVVKPVTTVPARLPGASPEVGTVRFIHAAYGVFVALDAGAKVAVGDALEVLENGKAVAQLKLERIAKPDKIYPNGSAVCKLSSGKPSEGNRVRKVSP